ncbi:MAG TPA: serine hydroxymethyltransferase [Streptosporangiaceae bacterium]|nr:serine hydroxymethyltransferase [Streptosporangiaceae bacterium]
MIGLPDKRQHKDEGMTQTTEANNRMQRPLEAVDPRIAELLREEAVRQATGLELIPSENLVSEAVLEAMGSVFTNKYAEGYPGKRYYGGCEYADKVEQLAIDRAKELFGAEHANVQAHSGTQANVSVYMSALQPGDTVLGMNLSHGGHLTHGHPLNFSGRMYKFVSYGVRQDSEQIDYDEIERLGREHKPKMIVAGASAYSRIIDFERIAKAAKSVGALFFVDMAHIAGLVAAGEHPSPVPHADFVSTTTHKTLRGPRGAMIMSDAEHASAVDKAVFPGLQGGPHNHTTAAIAVALREAALPGFRDYAHQVVANAKALADGLLDRGYDLVSGGTDNHLILVDLTSKGIGGKPAAKALDRAGLETNYNTVPFDQRKPFDPSGLRIGTPAITTRGLTTEHMAKVAAWMDEAITAAGKSDEATLDRIAAEVRELLASFPAPGWSPTPA